MEVPQAKFRFTVEKITKIKEFHSEPFDVRGLQWRINVIKSKDGLNVYLQSLNKDTSDWSCMATCKFHLVSSCREGYDKSFKSPREFSAKRLSHGIKKFISLNELYDPAKMYIDNNSIVLVVKVKANVPIYLSESVVDKTTSICFKMDNIYDICGFLSPVTYIRGIPWRVKVYTQKVNKIKVLAVMLNCVYDDSKNWSCKASAHFHLKSFDPVQPSHEWISKKHKFTRTSTSHGCKAFITWDHLLDTNNGFVQNGSIVFDIKMNVEKPIGIGPKRTVECPICMENLVGLTVTATQCGHVFCKTCIERVTATKNACPTCKGHLLPSQIQIIYLP